MSVTAAQLSKSGARGKDLDAVVREQLLMIDDRLLRAERTWGRNVLRCDLPTNLTFPGLNKKDAQRIIYSMIVRSLQDRGFGVRLLLQAEVTALFLEWHTDLSTEEVDAMMRLIRQVIITADDVPAFLEQKGAAADGGARDEKRAGGKSRPEGPA